MNFKVALLIFTVGICFATSAQTVIEYNNNDFSEKIELTGQEIKTDMLYYPLELHVTDSLLFIMNKERSPVFDVLNLNTGKIIAQFGIRGRGPGELISPFGFQILPEIQLVLVKASAKEKVFYYSIPKIISGDKNNFVKSISIENTMAKWVKQVGDSLVCAISGNKDYQNHCIIPINNPTDTSFFGQFMKFPDEYDPMMVSNLLSVAPMDFSPDGKYMIEAFQDFNRIEIYMNKKSSIHLKGEENKYLYYGLGSDGPVLGMKNKRCYEKVVCANDYFIAAYSGFPYSLTIPYSTISNLYFFKYDGTPLKHIKLKQPINNLAIDTENQIIWGIDKTLEPKLIKFEYEL